MTASLTPMSTQTVLKVSHLASTQSLGDGAVIVLTDSGQLYTCNDTAETLLKLVDGRRTLKEIIDCALDEYDADRATLEGDFKSLAAEFVSEGILQT